MDLSAIEAVSFDLFETLVDGQLGRLPIIEWKGRRMPSTAGVLHDHLTTRWEIDFDRFMEAMRAVDREVRKPRVEAGREFPNQERFDELVRRLDVDDAAMAEELGEQHVAMIRAHTTMPEHHRDVLARLAARLPLALCSNFTHSPTALRILEENGLHDHFGPLVISDAVDCRKPAAGIFEVVLAGLEVAADRVLHVGDNLAADVSGAAAVGMRTAWITRSVPDRDAAITAHAGPAPDIEIADLSELIHRLPVGSRSLPIG